jgi:hypothetical protein
MMLTLFCQVVAALLFIAFLCFFCAELFSFVGAFSVLAGPSVVLVHSVVELENRLAEFQEIRCCRIFIKRFKPF